MKSVVDLKKLIGAVVAASALILSGCGEKEPAAPKYDENAPLKVGVMSGPEADIMQVAIDKAKKDSDLNAELVEFQDYITPNVALSDGSIDVNAFQHKPYLDSMINDRGLKLASVGHTFVYPIAAYSDKLEGLDQLADGSKVAIPNDPSNEGRTLILLHHTGLIKLKDVNNLNATPRDIAENPKNLEFVELEAPQLPRSLPDVALAFVNNTYAIPAGLTPSKALLVEGKDSPYVNLIVSRVDNKDDPRIAKLVAAYHSADVEQKARDLFKGGAVKGW
ncbi:MetQ/NlpA family ABC transporter substrate-binding protein [Sansalvadorimonas verongulae]|uniref:MetQ/NlpA family ABC transporter substrate-binding protein n=1 Tax=Sansalvadorimonas verongulae TaxID=2172824 RepID=UPI0012BC35F4|nr:MetQ/NlpA family lipoprotein [Sansalvadorimonas verongulae]MTI14755.1 MetQ/NlpA family lipoprotein [Sansalvadorimonas verongulae]